MTTEPWPAADFAAAVLAWYRQHGRTDLPWQRDPHPYRVWVAEIMLQQTQVATVLPYFARFMTRFPNLAALATAELDEVLQLWSGLGYYARARHLHQAARRIHAEHGGAFPTTRAAVQALPGIGRSTAGAILSFAYGQCQPVLDGNVKRVLARCFAVASPPSTARGAAQLWQLAETLLPRAPGAPVAAYNQALMDLGAMVCTPTRPRCSACPLRAGNGHGCLAQACAQQHAYPASAPRRSVTHQTLRWLLIRDAQDAVWLERRAPHGIWGGLWTPPELPAGQDPATWCRARLGVAPQTVQPLPPRMHRLTHRAFVIEPWSLRLGTAVPQCATAGGQWIHAAAEARLGLPAPLRRLLAESAEHNDSST